MADQNLKIQLSAIDKTQRAFGAVRSGLKRVSGSIVNVKTALVGLAAGAGLIKFATQIDDLAKASSRLGITVNELQSLQFAASQTGASSEELEKGLTRFSRSISEASSGIGTGLRAFEALGVTVTDTAGNLRPTNELLSEVSDRLATIESPADRVRIAFDLFGRSGVNLVNALQNGSGELTKLRGEFNAVTMELTGPQAKAVEEANDRFDKLGRILGSIGQQITSTLLPVLAKVGEFIVVNILKALSGATRALRNFLNAIVDLADEVGIQMNKFTFGEGLNEELDRIIFNLENAGKASKDANGNLKVLVNTSNAVAGGFERVNNMAAKTLATYDEFGDKISLLKEKTDTSRTALQQYEDATLDVKSALQNTAVNGLTRMEDALIGVVQGTMTAKDAFRSMAQSILADLARIYIRQQITGAISGFLPSIFGGKAIGGSVQRNQPYMVGERGPEMFVPNQSGSIVPNNEMGGGNGVVVNQTINLSTGVSQTVRTEVMNMLPQISEAAKGAVLDAKRRGGSFARFV